MHFMKWDGRVWTGFIWLRIGTSGGAVVNTVMNVLEAEFRE
jgi:hypothetical protein